MPAASSRSASSSAWRATCTVAASQCASGKSGQQRERSCAPRAAAPRPSSLGETQVVPPVVGLERHAPCATRRARRRGAPVRSSTKPSVAHASPYAASSRQASRACCGRDGERGECRARVGARHLELHDTGVGKPDVRRRPASGTCSTTRSNTSRARTNLFAFERLERRAAFDPGAVRREQRLERPRGSRRSPRRTSAVNR